MCGKQNLPELTVFYTKSQRGHENFQNSRSISKNDCGGNPMALSFHHHRFLIFNQELSDLYFWTFLQPFMVSQQGGNTGWQWAGHVRISLPVSSAPRNSPFPVSKTKDSWKKSSLVYQHSPIDELCDWWQREPKHLAMVTGQRKLQMGNSVAGLGGCGIVQWVVSWLGG